MNIERIRAMDARVAMHRSEAKRITTASLDVRAKGFNDIADQFLDRALSHDLAASRLVREAHAAGHVYISGEAIRKLMRFQRVTIRSIKAQHCLTLKRIREVRADGVTGFRALEWIYLITGAWPVAGDALDLGRDSGVQSGY